MKIAIVYFSQSGRTRAMAEEIEKGLLSRPGVEVKLLDIDSADKDYIAESRAVIFGTPTHLADMSWKMKKWLDESGRNGFKLGGKLGAVFATADFIQGGADTAIQNVIKHLLVTGMLVYSSGGSLGQPFIHLGAVALKDHLDLARPLFKIFGERIADKALELFS